MKKTLSLLTSLILLATLALSCVPAFAEELNLTVYYGATLEQMSPVLEAFQAKYPNINVKSYRAANEELGRHHGNGSSLRQPAVRRNHSRQQPRDDIATEVRMFSTFHL